jgi:hypothetical protein
MEVLSWAHGAGGVQIKYKLELAQLEAELEPELEPVMAEAPEVAEAVEEKQEEAAAQFYGDYGIWGSSLASCFRPVQTTMNTQSSWGSTAARGGGELRRGSVRVVV